MEKLTEKIHREDSSEVPLKDKLKLYKNSLIAIVRDDYTSSQCSILIAPAQTITSKKINFLLRLGKGHPFVVLSKKRADEFGLTPMIQRHNTNNTKDTPDPLFNTGSLQTISVEAKEDIGSGISSSDRAKTILTLADPSPSPQKIVCPGHIFPIISSVGGTLVKNALPEAALDLTTLAGFRDATVMVHILDNKGDFASPTIQNQISKKYNIPIITLSNLVRYRLTTENLIKRVAVTKIPLYGLGEFTSIAYRSNLLQGEHLALIKGTITPDEPILTRVQSESTFTDVFGTENRNSTREQIKYGLSLIAKEKKGVLLYLRKTSFGTLKEQILENNTKQTNSAIIMRAYGIGAQILRDLGVKKIKLLTRSKKNLVGLKPFQIEIASQIVFAD